MLSEYFSGEAIISTCISCICFLTFINVSRSKFRMNFSGNIDSNIWSAVNITDLDYILGPVLSFSFLLFFFLFCHFHEYISCDIEKRKQKEEMLFSACLVLFHYRFFLWSRKTHTYTIIWNREKLYRNETKYALILNSLILKIDGKLIFSICLTYGFQYFQKKRIKKKSNVNICRWFSFKTEIHIKIAR